MDKYVIVKTHMSDLYCTIYSKELYPVALNPLYIKKSCVHEINIRNHEYWKVSQKGQYSFKDVRFKRKLFRDYEFCEVF